MERIFDKLNFLCLNEKEENHYRAYDGCKSIIYLMLTNLRITSEYKWRKEYKLNGTDPFPIIIDDEREVHQKKRNWMQFQKEGKITTRV